MADPFETSLRRTAPGRTLAERAADERVRPKAGNECEICHTTLDEAAFVTYECLHKAHATCFGEAWELKRAFCQRCGVPDPADAPVDTGNNVVLRSRIQASLKHRTPKLEARTLGASGPAPSRR